MDMLYVLILIVFALIIFCDYMDRKSEEKTIETEKFTNYEIENIGGFNEEPYTDEKNLVSYNVGSNLSSVNFNYDAKNLNFKNFGTDGVVPPYMKCPMCQLQFDCTSYPYNVNQKEGNVCTTCMDRIYLDEHNFPVLARTNGRPRVCKNLM
jgi:hypothetical protein